MAEPDIDPDKKGILYVRTEGNTHKVTMTFSNFEKVYADFKDGKFVRVYAEVNSPSSKGHRWICFHPDQIKSIEFTITTYSSPGYY